MKLNLDRLHSIQTTLEAIADMETAMEWYSNTTKAGPAYLRVEHSGKGEVKFQMDRVDFLALMESEKDKLIRHLEHRFKGFEYDPNASWKGDN